MLTCSGMLVLPAALHPCHLLQLAADDEAVDAEKDAAAMLINTGVKAMGKVRRVQCRVTHVVMRFSVFVARDLLCCSLGVLHLPLIGCHFSAQLKLTAYKLCAVSRPLIFIMCLQASKLLNKLGNKLQEKASKMLDEGRAGSTDLRYDGSGSATSAYSSSTAAAASYQAPGAYGSAGSTAVAAARSADAASKGDIKKVVAAADGSMWVGYKRGVLEKYSEAGQLLWSSATAAAAAAVFRPSGITALAAIGSSIWAGDNQGQLWVLDAGTAALQRSWKAHVFPVRSIAAGGHLVYSLGKAGSIRGWPALQPPPALTAAWQQDLGGCLQEKQLTVSCVFVWIFEDAALGRRSCAAFMSAFAVLLRC
jgi:hypothetical protein